MDIRNSTDQQRLDMYYVSLIIKGLAPVPLPSGQRGPTPACIVNTKFSCINAAPARRQKTMAGRGLLTLVHNQATKANSLTGRMPGAFRWRDLHHYTSMKHYNLAEIGQEVIMASYHSAARMHPAMRLQIAYRALF